MVTSERALEAALKHMDGPFDWCAHDCCRTASRAFRDLWGVDPMGAHGFATARQAFASLASAGGRDAYVQRCAERAGLRRSGAVPGAIGVVLTGRGFGWGLGICVKEGAWATKGDFGVRFFPDFERAWVV